MQENHDKFELKELDFEKMRKPVIKFVTKHEMKCQKFSMYLDDELKDKYDFEFMKKFKIDKI